MIVISVNENIQSTEWCQIQDPDMMWPKRRKSDLVVRPGGISFRCKTVWGLTPKIGLKHITQLWRNMGWDLTSKLANFSAIRDGALHAKEGSKGSRGACPNQCTYQDYQVDDGW